MSVRSPLRRLLGTQVKQASHGADQHQAHQGVLGNTFKRRDEALFDRLQIRAVACAHHVHHEHECSLLLRCW